MSSEHLFKTFLFYNNNIYYINMHIAYRYGVFILIFVETNLQIQTIYYDT